ncbi:glycoside hydrolase family 3 N-terminal domain-containing protein [Corynebacterium sp.]|uniref:glycoside hydrolase family 3 N-terminal domain-containing protein n=1 Tax=Corynebacterium sp. TaxID=1720 RepID=UPI0026E0D11C|nr:glycoside hydrolase family 3 N-terminal domain-containing protein [Corynebacterium sp.]MDO5512355.1 glycoside hydrolase family 3 N-terminal domain-containing protein [Corynebacterium sp.]
MTTLAAGALAAGVVGCAQTDGGETAAVTTTSESSVSTPPPPTTTAPPTPEDIARANVPEDRRARAASLMVVGVDNYDDALWKLQQGVGGIFIPSWAHPELLGTEGRNIAALRREIGRSFSVSIDFEGGRVQRHAGILGPRMSPREMAATMSPEQVEAYARDLGESLRRHGVTVDFAPVLDVDAGGLEIVGDRSFSRDPILAGEYGAAFARGLRAAGITPVFKHFPGHGQASGDTHHMLAVTPPVEAVVAHDLPPYAVALPQTEAGVMVGHMVVPGLGDGVTPSSLDPAAYQLLRTGNYPGGRPFDGVVYTDDLTGMRAVTDRYSLPEAVVFAVRAGADRPLFSSGGALVAAIDALDRAVAEGHIPAERLASAAFRVQLQLFHTGA